MKVLLGHLSKLDGICRDLPFVELVVCVELEVHVLHPIFNGILEGLGRLEDITLLVQLHEHLVEVVSWHVRLLNLIQERVSVEDLFVQLLLSKRPVFIVLLSICYGGLDGIYFL